MTGRDRRRDRDSDPGARRPRRRLERSKKPATGRPETEEGVYVVKNGKLEFDKVETGIAGELMIEVKKGPAAGQQIVTGPFKVLRQVKEGDRVIIEDRGRESKKGSPKPA